MTVTPLRVVLASGLALTACIGATIPQLKERAARSLKCDEAHIVYSKLDSETYAVSGCGRDTKLVQHCFDTFKTKCEWERNVPIHEQPAAPDAGLSEVREHDASLAP